MKIAIVLPACLALAFGACPDIVSRAEWGARPPDSVSYQDIPVPYVVIHHGATPGCTDFSSCSAMVRDYQDLHMDGNGWSDIGYSFIIGEDGNVYEGRGWERVGAHAPGFNSYSIGICFIGTFTSRIPNAAAISAAKNLIQCGVDQGYVYSDHGLMGHRQAIETECPGNALYAEIQNWANFEPNP